MATTLRADRDTSRGAGATRALGDLVHRAAMAAPDASAISRPGTTVTFGQLRIAAETAMITMSASSPLDDSTLTVALMMTVPGLAASGPPGLADTLEALRAAAAVAAGAPERTR